MSSRRSVRVMSRMDKIVNEEVRRQAGITRVGEYRGSESVEVICIYRELG